MQTLPPPLVQPVRPLTHAHEAGKHTPAAQPLSLFAPRAVRKHEVVCTIPGFVVRNDKDLPAWLLLRAADVLEEHRDPYLAPGLGDNAAFAFCGGTEARSSCGLRSVACDTSTGSESGSDESDTDEEDTGLGPRGGDERLAAGVGGGALPASCVCCDAAQARGSLRFSPALQALPRRNLDACVRLANQCRGNGVGSTGGGTKQEPELLLLGGAVALLAARRRAISRHVAQLRRTKDSRGKRRPLPTTFHHAGNVRLEATAARTVLVIATRTIDVGMELVLVGGPPQFGLGAHAHPEPPIPRPRCCGPRAVAVTWNWEVVDATTGAPVNCAVAIVEEFVHATGLQVSADWFLLLCYLVLWTRYEREKNDCGGGGSGGGRPRARSAATDPFDDPGDTCSSSSSDGDHAFADGDDAGMRWLLSGAGGHAAVARAALDTALALHPGCQLPEDFFFQHDKCLAAARLIIEARDDAARDMLLAVPSPLDVFPEALEHAVFWSCADVSDEPDDAVELGAFGGFALGDLALGAEHAAADTLPGRSSTVIRVDTRTGRQVVVCAGPVLAHTLLAQSVGLLLHSEEQMRCGEGESSEALRLSDATRRALGVEPGCFVGVECRSLDLCTVVGEHDELCAELAHVPNTYVVVDVDPCTHLLRLSLFAERDLAAGEAVCVQETGVQVARLCACMTLRGAACTLNARM